MPRRWSERLSSWPRLAGWPVGSLHAVPHESIRRTCCERDEPCAPSSLTLHRIAIANGYSRTRIANRGKCMGQTNDFFGRPSIRPQISDSRVAVRLAQLLIRRLHDQWVMQERQRVGAAEKSGDAD